MLAAAEALPVALADLGPTLLQLQRDLFVAGAELAANSDAWDRLVDGQTRVDEAMLERLEALDRPDRAGAQPRASPRTAWR